MMHPGDQQQQQQQQQHSPRGGGGGGGAGGGGMPKLSLLSHYPSAAAAAAHGFSLLGALEQQQQQQQQQQHHQPQQFQHQTAAHQNAFQSLLQQGFLLTTAAAGQQGYNLQLAAPQMLQGLMEDLIKLSPPAPPPPPPPGSPPMEQHRGTTPYSLLSLLEHKTEQLQALVHSLSQSSQHNGGVIQPHAAMAAARIASNISQIALATVGLLPANLNSPDLLSSQPPPPPPPPPPSHQPGPPQPVVFSMATSLSVGTPSAIRNPLPHPEPQPPAFNLQLHQSQQQQQQQQQQQKNAAPALPTVPAASEAGEHQQQQAQQQQQQQQQQSGGVAAMEDVDSAAGSRDEEDDGEAEDLVPGTYDLVEMNAVEILAEHTHFCDKCGKGFKRDANLRMHMRGHGEQYKSPAALARPDKFSQDVVRPRRYSCPYAGCKRNKKHRKFQPLKTVLCVKNHYRRSHCPKSLTCSKCKSKKFSVVADLKTHEKHCGRDKWQCSCGTTFSRKDKLLGHISLFQGHTPALPLNDAADASATTAAASAAANEQGSNDEGGQCSQV